MWASYAVVLCCVCAVFLTTLACTVYVNKEKISALHPVIEPGSFGSYHYVIDCHLQTAVCEWVPPDHLANELPRLPNILVAHLVYRTLDMLDPPQPPAAPPSFPKFLLRASFIGKPFSGKTTMLKRLEKGRHPLCNLLEQSL